MGSHVARSRDADLPKIIDHKRLLQSDWPAVHSAWLYNFGVCISPDLLPHSAKSAGLYLTERAPSSCGGTQNTGEDRAPWAHLHRGPKTL